ncbi:suppressor of cytokine signaling 7 [Echinococcus multilocularis]|uniref:Suppressor of cytokine signaling 7 n=1 Tax=Echinococcus multilocularis TaxID=6211 RepID=A0A068Y931_ECHMU|nr:suppressor of cytokine signaling 7 [Echinococcus multilocularis]
MRRSTPGVFSGVEPHTPRVCGSKSNSSFRANSDDSRRCIPPPVPCRNQPPPLPPKHHLRKNTGVEFNKHREPLEPLDSYGKYVYESISDSNVSSRSNRHLPLPRSYATRNFPQSSTTSPFGFRSVSPHTFGLNCGGRNVSGHAPYDARTFKYPFSTPFAFDPNSELLKGPCTCSLGAGGGKKLSFNSSNQSPVWSKMPSVVTRPSDAVQSKATRSGASDQNHQEKKSTHVDNRPWTISRLSRTMSRFFRRGMSHRKSKSNPMRSRSDYFNDFQNKFNGNIAPVPSHLSAVRSPAVTLPSSPSVPLPPTVPPLTEETATSSSALHCHDAVRHQHPVQTVAMVSTSTEMPTCTSPPSISCVHHVHHIHHVHHVHHHLHHLPPPPPPPPASLPSPGSQAVTSFPPPVTDDAAAALIMMLENAATLGETPPPPTLPLSVLKDSKSAEQQVSSAGNSHTYSAYGVRSGATPACCPISPTPPPPQPPPLPPQPSSASTLHRQNTTVCSDPRCITAHCRRHVQGSPGDHQHRTPTSVELAELAEAGAEAVFANGGNGGRTTTMTTTSSSSCTDPLPPSPPNATSVVPSCPNSPAPPTPAATAGAGTTPAPTHLMHHMHHHHMHHMLHHLRPPSTTATANAAAIAPVHPAPAAAPGSSSAVSNSTTTPDHRSSFQESMKALRKMGWYWGPLSFTEAEKLLANRPDGTFLVRDSAHDTFFLSLSFRVRGTTYHTRIEHNQGRFSFWFEPESHSASTVVEFIEKAVAHSIGGKYHYFLQTSTPGQQPVEVSLLYPLSRFQVVQSLKHLARFTILSHVRRDHVARLPLPPGQIGYLLEKQVYWESLEDFEETIRDRPPLQFTPVAASSSSSTAKP